MSAKYLWISCRSDALHMGTSAESRSPSGGPTRVCFKISISHMEGLAAVSITITRYYQYVCPFLRTASCLFLSEPLRRICFGKCFGRALAPWHPNIRKCQLVPMFPEKIYQNYQNEVAKSSYVQLPYLLAWGRPFIAFAGSQEDPC